MVFEAIGFSFLLPDGRFCCPNYVRRWCLWTNIFAALLHSVFCIVALLCHSCPVTIVVEEYFKIRQSFVLTQLLTGLARGQSHQLLVRLTDKNIKITGSMFQLLVILIKELTETGSTQIELPLSKFLALRGLRDEKFARKQLLSDLEMIGTIRFEYCHNKSSGEMRIAKVSGECGYIQNSVLHFTFDKSFLPLVPINQYMWMPYDILHTHKNENISARLLLTWRICQHKRMNLDRANADTVPIKSLLVCSPIPYPGELGKARQLNKRIIEPFEKALDNCECFSWQYADNQPETYTDFAQIKVKIHWHTDPYADSTSLKAAKAKRRVKGRNKGSGG